MMMGYPTSNPKLENHHLSAVLSNPQLEVAPCRGDKGPYVYRPIAHSTIVGMNAQTKL
jgi:hypothetical protein